jgi:hypothetical protein
MLLIPELTVRPAMVLLSRASPGVSQTPYLGRHERPIRPEVVGHDASDVHFRERAARFVRRLHQCWVYGRAAVPSHTNRAVAPGRRAKISPQAENGLVELTIPRGALVAGGTGEYIRFARRGVNGGLESSGRPAVDPLGSGTRAARRGAESRASVRRDRVKGARGWGRPRATRASSRGGGPARRS